MTELTTAEKCRVVAERWGLIPWATDLVPDIPNDPVAASALWDALAIDGWYSLVSGPTASGIYLVGFTKRAESHFGQGTSRWAALLDAAAAIAEAEARTEGQS